VVASMVLAAVLIRPVEDLFPDLFSRPHGSDDAASSSAGLDRRGPLAAGNT